MKLVIREQDNADFPKELLSPVYYIVNKKNKEKPFLIENKEGKAFNLISATLDVNQINFFIGANNSGKSRFMRGLLKISPEPYEHICNSIFYLDLLDDLSDLYNRIEDKTILEELELELDKIKEVIPTENSSISNFGAYKRSELQGRIDRCKKRLGKGIEDNLNNYIVKLEKTIEELWFSIENKISKKTYITVLRSLLENDYLTVDVFKSTVKKVFFEDKDFPNGVSVETGLNLWRKIDEMRRSSKIRDIESFELFLSECFFEGKRVELLASDKSASKPLKLMSIAIDRGDFRSVNEVGDGIQTIMLLLFPIFTAERNECFYIEEPETNLHPAFQRIFIETLLTNEILAKKNLKYFFTTHSNHFLDLTLRSDKVSFFQFRKIKEDELTKTIKGDNSSFTTYYNDKTNKHLIKTNIKPNKETLDELGVNNSSVFLANTSLWVEGPTDRKYLARFLRLYCKHENKPYLKEDIDFAFFEYGGNLIAHYLFDKDSKFEDDEIREYINAFANANKIYLLADNDNVEEGSAKKKRQKNLESLARENPYFKYQNTVVKEIENLLPVKVLKDFMLELLKTESSKKTAKKITFKREVYLEKGIGQFYEDLFKKHKIAQKDFKVFKVQNGTSTTLKGEYKNKLANFVLDGDYTYEDLIEDNDHLKDLIEGLYSFINNENSTEKE